MNFTLQINQNGILVVQAVDGDTPPNVQPLPSDVAATGSDSSIQVLAVPGTPGSFSITGKGVVGTPTVTVTGTNAAGTVISTTFTFNMVAVPPPADVATGFTATLTNVQDN
jgi:hypothetical protein